VSHSSGSSGGSSTTQLLLLASLPNSLGCITRDVSPPRSWRRLPGRSERSSTARLRARMGHFSGACRPDAYSTSLQRLAKLEATPGSQPDG
jgi:hypothetical protein